MSVESQLRSIQTRVESPGSLLVAGYCRANVKTQQLPLDIIKVIITLCIPVESWNTKLKGTHIEVEGTDHDTIVRKSNVGGGAQSAYGTRAVFRGGIYDWKIKIVKWKELNRPRSNNTIRLAIGLVTGNMDKASKDVNTYFGGFGSKQFEFAIRKCDLRLRIGQKRISVSGRCKEGDVIGVQLDLNEGTVSCTVNDKNKGGLLPGLPKNEIYHLAASMTGTGTTIKIVSYQELFR